MFFRRNKVKPTKHDREADKAFNQMKTQVNMNQYGKNVARSVSLSARDAFLDLNPALKAVHTSINEAKNKVTEKYQERRAQNDETKGITTTSRRSLRDLAMALGDVMKESKGSTSNDPGELSAMGIEFDSSQFKMDADENIFADGDGLEVYNRNVVINHDTRASSSISSVIIKSTMSLLKVNQQGFESVVNSLGAVSQSNIAYYNTMMAQMATMTNNLSNLARLTKISTVAHSSTTGAMDELIMGNFTMTNLFKAYKESNTKAMNNMASNSRGGMKDFIMGIGSNMLADAIRSGKLGRFGNTLKRGSNLLNNSAFTAMDYLESGKAGSSKLANKLDEFKGRSRLLSKLPNFSGDKGLLNKGASSLRKMLFGDRSNGDGYDIRNHLDKGERVAFDAETHNSINVVIPGYLGKILKHFTGTEIVNDYSTGKWVTVEEARESYNSKVKASIRYNDQVSDLGKRIFGEDTPESYADLMEELAKDRGLTKEDIQSLSGKYGEAAYKLYNAIVEDEDTYKDFKIARNSAAREIYKINKNREFSGSMLNAFNDKIDLVNDVHTEASLERMEQIKSIHRVVTSITNIFSGKDGEGTPADQQGGGLMDLFTGGDGQGGGLADTIDTVGDLAEVFSSRRVGRGKTLNRSPKGTMTGRRRPSTATSSTTPKSSLRRGTLTRGPKGPLTTSRPRSSAIPKLPRSGGKGRMLSGIIENVGPKVGMGALVSMAGGTLTSILGRFRGGKGGVAKPSSLNKPDLTPEGQVDNLPKVLDQLGEGNVSRNKLSKLMQSSPIARSLTDFVKKTSERDWFIRGKSIAGRLLPIGFEGMDLFTMFSQILAGNPVGGILGYGMGKVGGKVGEKAGGGGIMSMILSAAGAIGLTQLSHLAGGLLGGVLGIGGNKEAKSAENSTGEQPTSETSASLSSDQQKNQESSAEGQELNGMSEIPKTGMAITAGSAGLATGLGSLDPTGMDSLAKAESSGNVMEAMGYKKSDVSGVEGAFKSLRTGDDASYIKDENGATTPSSVTDKLGTLGKSTIIGKNIGGLAASSGLDGVAPSKPEDLTPDRSKYDETLEAPTRGLTKTFEELGRLTKNNPILTQMMSNPKSMASKLLAFSPIGAAFTMTHFGKDPNKPSGAMMASIDSYFKKIQDKVDDLVDVVMAVGVAGVAALESAGGGGGGGTSGSHGLPGDLKSFLKLPIGNDFGVDMDKAMNDFLKKSVKAKNRLGNIEKVKEFCSAIRDCGFSPEYFMAYEIQEQNPNMGWLNHYGTPQSSDTIEDARIVARKFVKRSQDPDPLQMAYYDMGFPNHYRTPLDVYKKAQEDAKTNLPKGSIGRIYVTMTSAAFWALYDEKALKKEVNKVQDYSNPFAGVMKELAGWGAKSGGGSSSAEQSSGGGPSTTSSSDTGSSTASLPSTGGTSPTPSSASSAGPSEDKKKEEEEEKFDPSKVDVKGLSPEDAKKKIEEEKKKWEEEQKKKKEKKSGGPTSASELEALFNIKEKDRSKSLAHWDEKRHMKVIETMAKKYTMMYDAANKKLEGAALDQAAQALDNIDGSGNELIAAVNGGNVKGSSATSSGVGESDPNKISYVDQYGNVVVTGDPEAIAVAKDKLKVDNDILDILKRILKATKDIGGYTKDALTRIIKMVQEIEKQTNLTVENNDISEITNELLKRLRLGPAGYTLGGGSNVYMEGADPLDFELDTDLLRPILLGS